MANTASNGAALGLCGGTGSLPVAMNAPASLVRPQNTHGSPVRA